MSSFDGLLPPASTYSLILFSYSAIPTVTPSRLRIGFVWIMRTSFLSVSRRMLRPWSMKRTTRRQASTPLRRLACLKSVSASPERQQDRKPHKPLLSVVAWLPSFSTKSCPPMA